jgi:hypothetical protein
MTITTQPEVLSEYASRRRLPRLELLAGAWLASYRNELTRRAYRSDLRAWLAFCETDGLDPLRVGRSHVELFGPRESSMARVSFVVPIGPLNTCGELGDRFSSLKPWQDGTAEAFGITQILGRHQRDPGRLRDPSDAHRT